MPYVFISYVRNNKRQVQRLSDELTKHGVKVWLDRNRITPGSDWQQAIRRAIQDGAFFIACFSIQYNRRKKTFMNEELTIAIDELRQRTSNEAWFIPVKLNRCEIPDFNIDGRRTLENLHYTELYKDWNDGIQSIIDVIQPIPANVQKLIETLDSDDDLVRRAAFMASVQTGHPAVIPALTQALEHKDEEKRVSATYALYTLADDIDPEAVPPLIQALTPSILHALNDENNEVRENVAYVLDSLVYVLRSLDDPETVPALVQALKDEDFSVRLYVANILGDMKDPAAVPALVELLSDGNDFDYVVVPRALRNIGTPEALEAIQEYENQKREK